MNLRDYHDSDVASVLTLWCHCFPEVESASHFRDVIDRKRATQPDPFLVAVERDEVVGTAVGGMDGINGWIYLVAVQTDFRRKGIGHQLVRAVESRLVELGAIKVGLQVMSGRPDLVAFYNSLGYAIEPRESMAKRLSP